MTVNRTAGTWFASFCLEDGQPVPPVEGGPTIGVDVSVDVGVGRLAACSNGLKVENPKALKSALKRLRQVDQAIAKSRNAHHGNRREGPYVRRRTVHARIGNVRNDNHHKATTAIAKSAGRVVVETLNVSGMLGNRRLSRGVTDSGHAGFLANLAYRCSWYEADYLRADRWFPPSKLFAHCGWHNGELELSDRQWWCRGCGAFHDRDGNAAENLSQWPSSSFSVSGRGGRVSPAMPAVASEASMNLAIR